MLEIWGKAAPHLFTLAPDIYIQNLNLCRRICEEYTASGAPLLIPESAANVSGAMMLTRAIADFGAVGVAAFGIEGILDSRGEVLPQMCIRDRCRMTGSADRCFPNPPR